MSGRVLELATCAACPVRLVNFNMADPTPARSSVNEVQCDHEASLVLPGEIVTHELSSACNVRDISDNSIDDFLEKYAMFVTSRITQSTISWRNTRHRRQITTSRSIQNSRVHLTRARESLLVMMLGIKPQPR